MIWIIVIAVVGFILFSFLKDVGKDNTDLKNTDLKDKFNIVVNELNKEAFSGKGQITKIDTRSFNLYEPGQNQTIQFQYGTGHLTITWRYKYYQKEIVHEKTYSDVRNLSLFEQQKISDDMIKQMQIVIERHKRDVTKDAF